MGLPSDFQNLICFTSQQCIQHIAARIACRSARQWMDGLAVVAERGKPAAGRRSRIMAAWLN